MSLPTIGDLPSFPALERPELLAAPVATVLADWPYADQVAVVEIDPDLADTEALNDAYGLDPLASANCVIVSGRRAGEERVAACVVRADTRADVNRTVKGLLDVRKCSFHPMDRATGETTMEYGGITPVGLPPEWRLLIDSRVAEIPVALIGSGLRRSKLLVPGALLAELPEAEVVEGLAG
ncbi:hypothetical protein GCM10011519_31200 [Marmoricola endophyticus]|uniref:YbaK/aminoacyl-tRNA synthetase-associated domain-containing protein n=1 Tax=Marmoricola endophyticus TaxID=2040280 RepID=A0A917BRS2_9ACTN|nr:YbaK/EbsC family protein [Marmoricola endophyticus]GGF55059.1 hypothetical protein GCM10011519_31200 [Marmoricola endophyticus]